MVMFDVVESILLRLPVNDILRCKSICKSWYSEISSPSFVKTQVKSICNKEEDNTRKIAMRTSYLETFGQLGYRMMVVPSEWEYYHSWSMQGSCNGLVCIYSGYQNRTCVTNPVTREFRELKNQPKRIAGEQHMCFGFGYDSSSDDYKVVLAICQKGRAFVAILSLKSNEWKVLEKAFKFRFDDSTLAKPGILFNGALHWFWLRSNDTTRGNILLLSFDLAKEKFREIPQPDDTLYVWNYGYQLGIIEGRLCIFQAYDENEIPSHGIWVMESDNSWKLFPNGSEMMKDHAIHYMIKDTDEYRETPPPTYYCDENTQLSRSMEHIPSPMFVQTLVSPYMSSQGLLGSSSGEPIEPSRKKLRLSACGRQ